MVAKAGIEPATHGFSGPTLALSIANSVRYAHSTLGVRRGVLNGIKGFLKIAAALTLERFERDKAHRFKSCLLSPFVAEL